MGQMVRDMLDVISPGSPYRLKGRATQAWGPGPLLASRAGLASVFFSYKVIIEKIAPIADLLIVVMCHNFYGNV